MSRKAALLTALAMLIAAVVFVIFALNHPQMSFPWSNSITNAIYAVYVLAMLRLVVKAARKSD